MSSGTILFLDAYDSFSNNITSLLRHELGVKTETIKIDDPRFVLNDNAFYEYLQSFDAVVAGPGPGHPGISQDVGLIAKLWTLPEDKVLPILGICLGFQSLCTAFGAQTQRLNEPRHGIVTKVTHKSNGIFRGAQDQVSVTQYHSLHMLLSIDSGVAHHVVWEPTPDCPGLKPLAWDLDDTCNGSILMAVEHLTKPFTGVQFHPESICTSSEGKILIKNWWQQTRRWNDTNRSAIRRQGPPLAPSKVICGSETTPTLSVQHVKLDSLRPYDVTAMVDNLLPYLEQHPLLLQSGARNGRALNSETGQYSILGFHDKTSTHIRYSCKDRALSVSIGETSVLSKQFSVKEAFEYLDAFIAARKVSDGPEEIPFWGGLIGFVTYEAGLASIEVQPTIGSANRPDMWFVFVDRSVVVDHVNGVAYVQSIRQDDTSWLHEIASVLSHNGKHACTAPKSCSSKTKRSIVVQPEQAQYCRKVVECQAHLRAGSSYELCLTDQTVVQSDEEPWAMYKRLSALNPAPFGAYIRLQDPHDASIGMSIAGSSPERFLAWSRSGCCQFRPIKGTVSKATGFGRQEAEAILRTRKEVAENLMIVDLIRHDLAGVAGVRNVHVPTLMSVEEYETVFQLVSVIGGDLDECTSGVAVLAASLPPGSMTGAPKRRSCELLQTLEDHKPRGLYSGVLGYMDVGGGGDFSVVIRSAFKWNDEDAWRIGAGGAVTVLSTAEGEYDEMLVKRHRILDVVLDPNR